MPDITHALVADGDPLVGATDWNDPHTVPDGALAPSKLAFSATDKVLGRSTAGAGNGEEIAVTAAGRALIDDADAAAQRTTLGLGTAATSASTAFDASGAAAAAQAASQPLDSDLTAIAALSTTAYGRAVLELANQAALLALLPGLNGLPAATGDLDVNTHKLTGVVDPTSNQHGATKKYVDDAVAGILAGGAITIEEVDGSPTVVATKLRVPNGMGAVAGTEFTLAFAGALAALNALTPAADKLPYFAGSSSAALADLTAAGRALIDDADVAAQRATLGIASTQVGYATIGGTTDSLTSSKFVAKPVTPATADPIHGLAIYLKGDGTHQIEPCAAIFDDNAGVPGKMLAWMSMSALAYGPQPSSTARWLWLPLYYEPVASTPIWIVAGAVVGFSGACVLHYDGSGGDYAISGTTAMADAGFSTTSGRKYSLYAIQRP